VNEDVRHAVADLLGSIAIENGKWSEVRARNVFQRLASEGWTRVGLPEELGGAGGGIDEAGAVATACAASVHQLPLADMVIATGRCLELAQLPLPADAECALPLAVVAQADSSGGLHVQVPRVPWGRWASHFLVVSGGRDATMAHLVDAAHASIAPGSNLAEEPRDEVVLSGAPATTSVHIDRPVDDVIHQVHLAGALTRSVQIAAASQAVLELCSTYCSQRRQFGRRLAGFQAVQQELAALKGEAAAAAAAVDHALSAVVLDRSSLPSAPIAAAKARAGMAAGAAALSAHQLHGAIGITLEYPLHRHTRALWSWRDEWGDEFHWAAALLAELVPDGSAGPWERLTAV
jgi:acyl-CoA dehydrogenase